jgi:PAS domain S-box-containing protein
MSRSTPPTSDPSREELIQRSLATSRVLCLVSLIVPALTAAGRLFGVPILTRILPALPDMQPVTAAALAVGTLAVMLTPERLRPDRRTSLALLPATIVLSLGVLTVSEYIGAWDAGIDRLLVDGVQPHTVAPSPQASLGLLLMGAALVAFNVRNGTHFGQIAAIGAGANAIAAANGYIFSAPTASGLPLTTASMTMTVHVILLVCALFCRRPNEGIMTLVTSDTQSGAIARQILAAAIFVPPIVGGLTRLGTVAGWYGTGAQGSLFVVVLAALILRTTWGTVRRSEREELQTRGAVDALRRANEEITLLYQKVSRLDEVKTQFFANLSHELRTPLTLILGPVEKHLRADATRDPDVRRDLEVIQRNARTVLRHVNDLLDVARLEAERLTPDYADAEAAALVRTAADHFSALAVEQQVDFRIDVPPSIPIQTDVAMLQRIVVNLLSNAFKVTPAGGHVRVSLRAADRRLRLEVADSGPGIPLDRREAVFERFQQLSCKGVKSRNGTGLGLSIVHDFAVLLGGSVSAGDAPEGGALFTLDIPCEAPAGTVVRRAGEQMDPQDIAEHVEQLRATPEPVSGVQQGDAGRVLVVEDNRDLNHFIADCLRGEGYDVLSAFDGNEGLEKALVEQPDLILTDVMMPIMTGDELVSRLRQRPELCSTPIVVLTASADEELRVRLLQEGVQDYLDKPFSVAELCARVRNLLARKRATDHVEHVRRQLEAVGRAGAEIAEAVANLPGDSVRTVLHTIALNARTLTNAELAGAGIGGDDTHPFEIFAHVGMTPAQVDAIGRQPRPIGVLGENKSIRLRDVREHPKHGGFPAHHPAITSFLAVPIRFRGHVVGNLYLGNKQGADEFTVEDQQMAEMLAVRAGSAVETARLYAAEGRAHAWLQAVLDQMPESIMLMDAQGRITMQNRSMHALIDATTPVVDRFGNSVTIDVRSPSGERLAADDLPIVRAIADRTVTVGQELFVRTQDQLMPLLVSASPILMDSGDLAGAVMVFQDITTLKELERLREEWTSIVAHDLRQPISVITLRSSLLLRGRLTHDQRDSVEQIASSVQSLSRMVTDLSDASLLESDRLRVTLDRLDLCELLEDIAERVPSTASRTTTQTPPGVRVFVKGDAQRLEQVMWNLLSNAAKYAPPETKIGLHLGVEDGHAHVRVTNTGPGIPSDELPYVFSRFGRSRSADASQVKGLGLGLYIAKGLVTAHRGRIWAESVPGDLTTFHITLPLDGPAGAVDLPHRPDAGVGIPSALEESP